MKPPYYIILLIITHIITTSCQKEQGHTILPSYEKQSRISPTVTIGTHWDLHRKSYNCKQKFSICKLSGASVSVDFSMIYDDENDWIDTVDSKGNDTLGYRNPKVKMQYDSLNQILRGKFCQKVDTSEGSSLIFGLGDNPDIDSVILAIWGINGLYITPDTYHINFDTTNSKFGEVILPALAY